MQQIKSFFPTAKNTSHPLQIDSVSHQLYKYSRSFPIKEAAVKRTCINNQTNCAFHAAITKHLMCTENVFLSGDLCKLFTEFMAICSCSSELDSSHFILLA